MIACIIETKQKSCGLENFTPQKNIYIANLESRSFLPRTRKPSKFTVMSIPKLWMHLGVSDDTCILFSVASSSSGVAQTLDSVTLSVRVCFAMFLAVML